MKTLYLIGLCLLILGCGSKSTPGTEADPSVDAVATDSTMDATTTEDSGPRAPDQGSADGRALVDAQADAAPMVDAASDSALVVDGQRPDAVPVVDAVAPDATPTIPDAMAPPIPDAGPAVPMACADRRDEDILDVVYNGPKVPPGFYSDDPGENAGLQWRTPCSESLEESRQRAIKLFAGQWQIGDSRMTERFYEVDAIRAQFTMHFRNTRCDWYGGGRLAGGPHDGPEALGDLAGYLWFTRHHNTGGFKILGGQGFVGNASHFYELCHVGTTFGDFGLRDEITLWKTSYRLGLPDGSVEVIEEAVIRRIQGNQN